ncbi:MAG: hypothetical protein ABI716_03415 [Candidatus Saccharibacteria bacterium]
MKNLVIAVSPDSSLELLRFFADVIILDKDLIPDSMKYYDTIYIRSHFSQPSTLPQNFRSEIDSLVQHAKRLNPKIKFIDNMDNVDTIVAFEDKWLQYKTFGKFMPRTELLNESTDISNFVHPVFKNRLSSRGQGVTWDKEKADASTENWIIQESCDIAEELRIYVICGEVYPIGAIRQNKTSKQITQAIDSRKLVQDEIDFSANVMCRNSSLDIVGLDIARTSAGKLSLMEVNRSPGFAKFEQLTGFNLASMLYGNTLS